MAYNPRARRQDPSWVPDYDPTGRQDASGENTPAPPPPGGGGGSGGGAGDLWSRVMDLLKGYGDVSAFQANRSALEPLIGGAQKAWGLDDEGLMSRLAYNPLKGMYTLASYLNGTPFYDKTGDGSKGNLFYVPGFRPPGWGADVPAQAQYDPSKHQYWV